MFFFRIYTLKIVVAIIKVTTAYINFIGRINVCKYIVELIHIAE